ncbi:hypothetical protein KBY97_13835 [Synechococcus sp. ATX 2A4]|uniref:hypothetical protein n=1 Tax=Synechococcus sp. ATX 2A4 TaxID=2823727 RepID=UPI0020CE8BB2|nr:hypothetical protein [Synechococcus sp. ATX 2A4]MCP9886195.1 hypothetical protein [Synechococcus sp. ATX 2A4]
MKTTELKKHHEELNLPVDIRLEIMEAHAERLESTLRDLYQVIRDRHHGRMPEEVEKAYNAAGSVLANAKIRSGD